MVEELLIESLRLLAISPQRLQAQLLGRLQLLPGALGMIEVQGGAVLNFSNRLQIGLKLHIILYNNYMILYD